MLIRSDRLLKPTGSERLQFPLPFVINKPFFRLKVPGHGSQIVHFGAVFALFRVKKNALNFGEKAGKTGILHQFFILLTVLKMRLALISRELFFTQAVQSLKFNFYSLVQTAGSCYFWPQNNYCPRNLMENICPQKPLACY